jgi:hypothetical protein
MFNSLSVNGRRSGQRCDDQNCVIADSRLKNLNGLQTNKSWRKFGSKRVTCHLDSRKICYTLIQVEKPFLTEQHGPSQWRDGCFRGVLWLDVDYKPES